MTRRSLIVGKDRFVVGPWHDDTTTAYLALAPNGTVLTSRASVERCVELLWCEGYRSVVTAALRANDAHVFHTAGFEVKERLQVLRHDLRRGLEAAAEAARPHPDDGSGGLRRAKRRDRPAVLAVDQLAFDSFWTLGADGLDEALHATSSVRFRVMEDIAVIGYAVCGRAVDIGYLQRLAVHPDHLRRGIGAALVIDALRWLQRRRSRLMLVNTQESNLAALALYEHLGFTPESERLTVMSWSAS